MAEDEDEDDYMSMVVADVARPAKETSIQRRARKQREAEINSRVKSKQEKKEEENAARDAALSTAIDPSNKGFKMMARLGYKPGETLGKSENARTEPIQLALKEDRGGIGMDSEKKRKIREEFRMESKRVKADEDDYRERMRLQREEARFESQIVGAQKVLEKLETDAETLGTTAQADGTARDASGKEDPEQGDIAGGEPSAVHLRMPLKSINVLWRGLIRQRLEREREGRMRRELAQFNSDEDPLQKDSNDDHTTTLLLDDLDEEDTELDDFNGLPASQRLEKLVLFLREHYNYCFWCKYRYPEPTMDGCPGSTEDDHD